MLSPSPSNPCLKSMGISSLIKQPSSPPCVCIPASHPFCYIYSPHTRRRPNKLKLCRSRKGPWVQHTNTMVAPCQQVQSLSTAEKRLSSRQRCDALSTSSVQEHYIQKKCEPVSLIVFYIGDTSHPSQFADRFSLNGKL